MKNETVTIVEAGKRRLFSDIKELVEYRDLFYFLVYRDIKVLYAQTILGFLWAILHPMIQIIIFTIVFGKVAKLNTEGIPYALFSSVAIIPWTYMSQAMTFSSQSLVQGQNMLGKIYFPRLIYPLTSIISKLVDFIISFLILTGMAIYYHVYPTVNLLLIPVFTLFMMIFCAGVGMWLSAMAIRFRDVKHAMSFVIRMLMYSAPIVYSASSIPKKYHLLYCLNPIVGIVEGFRACFLGNVFPWQNIWPGMVIAVVVLLSGMSYFKHMERVFVDVI